MTLLSGTHDCIVNGPVPTAFCDPLGSASCDGAGTMPSWPVNDDGNAAHGSFILKSAVRSPVTATESRSATAGDVRAEALWVSKIVFSTAAVSGVPSLN